jgi:DNA cross-link repair 1A protein
MGLKSSFDAGVIYCSHVTAALASMRLSVRKQRLCPLALETPADIPVGDASVRVTLIEANHCPGSTMMLFELPNRTRVLHTGDFRWSRAAMEKSRTMRQLIADAKAGHPIDVCYLDTTYLAPQYTFPSQEQAIEEVVEV